MDSLRWDCSSVVCNTSSLWSHQQHDIEKSFMVSNLIPEDIFASIQDIQKPELSHINSNYSIVQQLPPELDSINVVSNFNLPQPQIADFGLSSDGLQYGQAGISTTGSLDSLDTSAEEDGISMIFSECKNLWNFSSTKAISSLESASNKDTHRGQVHHEIDETVSQSSSESKFGANCSYFDLLHSDSSAAEGGFKLISENPPKAKKPRSEKKHPSSSNISFQQPSSSVEEPDSEAIAQMKQMIYRAAVFRPVNLGVEVVEKQKRKNVRISSDPQTVAARQRRERISERIRVLQRLVPGGSKMDTASMLDEAANYLKFLRSQVKELETLGHNLVNYPTPTLPFSSLPFNHSLPMQTLFPLQTTPNAIHHPKN